MVTRQNFIQDNERMDESDLEDCEEEAKRLLNVELVVGTNDG